MDPFRTGAIGTDLRQVALGWWSESKRSRGCGRA